MAIPTPEAVQLTYYDKYSYGQLALFAKIRDRVVEEFGLNADREAVFSYYPKWPSRINPDHVIVRLGKDGIVQEYTRHEGRIAQILGAIQIG